MLTDLLAAQADEAEAILSTSGHANIWPTLEAPSLDPMHLARLAFILQGKTAEANATRQVAESFERLASADTEGPWIDRVPPDLVLALATLPEDRAAAVADQWVATPEAQSARWDRERTAAFLQELSMFAASAVAQGRTLLLWRCP